MPRSIILLTRYFSIQSLSQGTKSLVRAFNVQIKDKQTSIVYVFVITILPQINEEQTTQ
jgi:hypothetical protein